MVNSLSALNLAASPELRSQLLARAPETLSPNSLSAAELSQLNGSTAAAQAPAGGSFSNLLGSMVQEVNSRQAAAGAATTSLISGGDVSLHQAMIAMEEASISFQLMVEVRNKLLESYQELMRMQI